VNSVGDAFGWAFKDPSWLGKIVVQALILIIPIVGWIAAVGWLMMAFENVRAGRNELPPAGFHLARGIGIFGVYVIYAIVLNIPSSILNGIGSPGFVSRCAQGSTSVCTTTYVGGPLSGLGSLWGFVASLFLDFLTPTLIVMVFHHGFGGGFDLLRIWRYATSNVTNSVIAGLIIFVTGFITAAGIIACCIGVFFTAIYAFSVQAGVAAWFERQQSAPVAPVAPPPPLPA
jgi:Protein of unknown function (DUF4013)